MFLLIRKPDGKDAKPGCDKPLFGLKCTPLIFALAALFAVCGMAAAFPAVAPGVGEARTMDGVAVTDAMLPYKPGEVLVRFTSSDAAAAIMAFLERTGLGAIAEEVCREGQEVFARLELEADVAVESAVELLNRLAGVLTPSRTLSPAPPIRRLIPITRNSGGWKTPARISAVSGPRART